MTTDMTTAVEDYKRKIYAIRDLPTLPVIAQKILTLADDSDTGAEKLSEIIGSDQALSVRVLSLANSAYFGYRAKIGTIRQAVVVIGTNMLKQVALSVLVCSSIDRNHRKRTEFWRHSLATATAASLIAKRARISSPDVCFMGGLLHDIGRLILHLYPIDDEDCSVDHAEVGAWMADRWQLPSELADAIAFHHSPDFGSLATARTVACVSLADACAHIAAADLEEGHAVQVHPDALKALRFDEKCFVEVAVDLKKQIGRIDEFLR
jgi:putative nucleotidyltransferase with HDIG domain